MAHAAERRAGGASDRPTIVSGIISAASVQVGRIVSSAPNDHLTASPHCAVIPPRFGRVDRAGSYPAIRAWIISPARVKITLDSSGGRVGRIGRRPSVSRWIVSAAGIQKVRAITSGPDDHLTASPNCRVKPSGNGRVGSARRYPTVGSRIVSPAGVEEMVTIVKESPSPYNHFTAGP